MNYIWDLVIKAEHAGILKQDIYFAVPDVYSPYMEVSFVDLNSQQIDRHVEINPYYRFHSIFRDLLDVDYHDMSEFKSTLFDMIVHLLAEIDILQGLNKRDYYIRFVIKDLASGMYGEDNQKKIELFNHSEKIVIASNILRLYETGEAVYLLKDTMRKIFMKSTIYANCDEKDELLFYVGQKESEKARAKIELIKDLFLPVRFHTEIYWEYHFGMIGVEETMQLDRIALY